jgi:phosphoenolpyruvate carboxykinase (ATP)
MFQTVIGRDLEYFSQAGFDMDRIQLKRNAPVAQLYEDAIRNEGAIISSSGALINFSGKKTGRSPKDKRIVYEETSKDDIWWGSVNIKMDEREFTPLHIGPLSQQLFLDTFEINRERAIDYLNTRDNVYVFDGFAGVSPVFQLHRLAPLTLFSGIPNTASRFGSFVPVRIMLCLWYVTTITCVSSSDNLEEQHVDPSD